VGNSGSTSDGRDGFKLVGDGKRQFSCHCKDSHHFFDGSGVGWFPRDGVTSFGAGVSLQLLRLRLDGRNSMVGDCL
jgi:hypothetical protein